MGITIDQLKKLAVPLLKEAGVVRSSVFGSVARGEATAESDVDILVEFHKERVPGLFGFVGLEQQLEEKLGRDVDLLTYNSLSPLLRESILEEQVSIL